MLNVRNLKFFTIIDVEMLFRFQFVGSGQREIQSENSLNLEGFGKHLPAHGILLPTSVDCLLLRFFPGMCIARKSYHIWGKLEIPVLHRSSLMFESVGLFHVRSVFPEWPKPVNFVADFGKFSYKQIKNHIKFVA